MCVIQCGVCRGKGWVVNPNIDAQGLTPQDFEEDPQFAEEYFSGMYDVTCMACGGSGEVTEERIIELQENAAERRLAAMEDGDWEAYQSAGDWRYG